MEDELCGAELAYEEGLRAYNHLLSSSRYGSSESGDLLALEQTIQRIAGQIQQLDEILDRQILDLVGVVNWDWDDISPASVVPWVQSESEVDLRSALTIALDRIEAKRCESRIAHALRSRPGWKCLNILDMPNEVLLAIIEQFDRTSSTSVALGAYVKQEIHDAKRRDSASIQNLRLVCRHMCTLSSRFLVPVLTIWTTPEGIKRLDEISRQPCISEGVRLLDIQTVSYSRPKTAYGFFTTCLEHLEALEEKCRDQVNQRSLSFDSKRELHMLVASIADRGALDWNSFVKKQKLAVRAGTEQVGILDTLVMAWRKYRQRFITHRAMVEDGSLFQLMANAVARTPLVNALRMSDCWLYEVDRRPKYFEYPESPKPLGIADFLVANIEAFDRNGLEQQQCDSKLHFQLLRRLPQAISAVGTPLKHLDINFNLDSSIHQVTKKDVHDLELDSRHLSSFAIRGTSKRQLYRGPSVADAKQLRNLQRIVAPYLGSPRLTSLEVDLGSNSCLLDRMLPLAVMEWYFPAAQNALQHLWLPYLSCHSFELRDFLARLPKEVAMHMQWLMLLEGSAAEALDAIREKVGRLSSLRWITCENSGSSRDYWDSYLTEYITGAIGFNPAEEIEEDDDGDDG